MITPTGKTAIVGSHTKMKRKEQEKLRWYLFLYRCARSISKSDEFLKEADSNQGDVINLLADKIIENARKNKFNIGNGNSDINADKIFKADSERCFRRYRGGKENYFLGVA